jgi:hypothetical protein
MLLTARWSKILLGSVLALVLAGIAFYYINEWWPGCNFAFAFSKGEEPLMIAAAKGGAPDAFVRSSGMVLIRIS